MSDPKILALAFLGGVVPSLLWLWFWMNEDKKNPEPTSVVALVFLMGMLSVIVVLPIQKIIQTHFHDVQLQIILWAATEEILKYLAVLVILFHTRYVSDAIDWPIYMITAALGFAAIENALFLIKPLTAGQDTVSLLTGQLRFLGSTLLHTVSSGILGISIGVSIHSKEFGRVWHSLVGLLLAISLHSIFNFFIIKNNGADFLRVFAFLWVITIIVLLLFEKVRRMN
jgi:RsiW-degrading membrane proteinase PrsW (M82 family)